MKPIGIIILGLFIMVPHAALSDDRELAIRTVIRDFYKAFDDGFVGPADYATEDWNHINPYGGRDRSREATLKTVREVHKTFLKGATDTIERPFDAQAILQRVRAAFPDANDFDDSERGQALNAGVSAAHLVMVKIFERLPAGIPLTLSDVTRAETQILRAVKKSSLREWLTVVGRHHNHSYRHCLFVTGFAVAFAQHLGMREDDQRRLARAALLHDVGKAFTPVAILDKPGKLTDAEMDEIRKHPRLGFEALAAQGGFPPEMLDVVLHHHEFLDGTGYPDGLTSAQISDIVRLITIVDIHAALVEKRSYRMPFTHAKAFAMMEEMGGKLDRQLLQAFRPVALGT